LPADGEVSDVASILATAAAVETQAEG